MSARDNFCAELLCPVCGRTGKAELSENDGYSYSFGDKSTRVDSLTDGFTRLDSPSWIRNDLDFRCVDHIDKSAVVKR